MPGEGRFRTSSPTRAARPKLLRTHAPHPTRAKLSDYHQSPQPGRNVPPEPRMGMRCVQSLCSLHMATAAPPAQPTRPGQTPPLKAPGYNRDCPHLISTTGPTFGKIGPLVKAPMDRPCSSRGEAAVRSRVFAAWCWAHLIAS